MPITAAQVELALERYARALRGERQDHRPTFAQACRTVNPELFAIMAAAINAPKNLGESR